ncbi:MAG TPA: hypothetical protein VD905_20035, partial [Flavobacteriales bacterium]|nr:hypothetical protein [Flavobacteriales bacterium]
MKTFLHTSLLLLVMVIAGNAKAQTTVTINSATDSSLANCPLPVNRNIMVYGTTTGYNDVTDNMTVQVFWGDGSDTTFIADLLDGGGITDYVYVGIPHNYFMAGSFSPMVIMTGPDGNDDTLVCPSFTLSSSCVIIDGYLYIDMNSNCVYDAGDAPASGQATVMNGSGGLEGLAYADASGYYSISVASGTSTYTLSATNSYMTTTCPVSGSYTFTPSASASFDMGLACVATSSDYYIHHTGMCGYGPPGGTGVISFTAGIGGCTGVSGTATFTVTLDPLVTYVSMVTGPAPTSVSGGG